MYHQWLDNMTFEESTTFSDWINEWMFWSKSLVLQYTLFQMCVVFRAEYIPRTSLRSANSLKLVTLVTYVSPSHLISFEHSTSHHWRMFIIKQILVEIKICLWWCLANYRFIVTNIRSRHKLQKEMYSEFQTFHGQLINNTSWTLKPLSKNKSVYHPTLVVL